MKNITILLQALFVSLVLFPVAAFAVDAYPPILCTNLFGCGAAPDNVILNNALPTAGGILIQLAGGGAVIAIVVAGVQMVLSAGDEGKVTSARKGILFALAGLGIALAAGPIVSFVSTEDYGQSAGQGELLFAPNGVLASAIRIIMVLFNVAFAIMVIVAGIRMITGGGNVEEFKKAGNVIKWAIIGGIIVNLARVLVHAFLALNL